MEFNSGFKGLNFLYPYFIFMYTHYNHCHRTTAHLQLEIYILYIINYTASVWNSTCSSIYLRLPVIQSKCLRVIGNHPRLTPTSHLHNCLHVEPIPVLIHCLTDRFFAHRPLHPNSLVQQISNYTLADLTNLYKKYKHKRTKHSFNLAVCLKTGPKPLPKRALHIVRSRASSFK